MTGRWHLRVSLEDREVVADYREPVVEPIVRVQTARGNGRDPEPSDVAAIVSWHEQNAALSEACARGECDHHVV